MRSLRINERIRVNQIRVIAEDGAQMGVMSPAEALRIARERGYDLVEVSPGTNPPVCRILDFNKFKYEEQRKERLAKRKHHVTKLKEVKFKPRIEAHDYQVKLGMLKRFLMRGDQAKVTMVYRGREMSHTELGKRILERLVEDLKPISKVERTPLFEGRFLTMIFGPDREGIKRLQASEQAARKRAERAGLAERARLADRASSLPASSAPTAATSGREAQENHPSAESLPQAKTEQAG